MLRDARHCPFGRCVPGWRVCGQIAGKLWGVIGEDDLCQRTRTGLDDVLLTGYGDGNAVKSLTRGHGGGRGCGCRGGLFGGIWHGCRDGRTVCGLLLSDMLAFLSPLLVFCGGVFICSTVPGRSASRRFCRQLSHDWSALASQTERLAL